MIQQAPHTLIMIRPSAFGFNPETADSNVFQQQASNDNVIEIAKKEFDHAVKVLKKAGATVTVFDDTDKPVTPDAVFPNNWFMAQPDGKLVICPMLSEMRRKERRKDIITHLESSYHVTEIIDISEAESDGKFLEGTGSIVFDHVHKKAYACPSARTDENLFVELCSELDYKPVIFISRDENGKAIYHTNVLLSIGSSYAVVCLDAVHPADHEIILDSLAEDNLRIISISYEQMTSMAGNILEIQTKNSEPVLVISETALSSLLPGQVDVLSRSIDIITVKIPTIEKVGGAGIRCMLAGVHLPLKK